MASACQLGWRSLAGLIDDLMRTTEAISQSV